MLRAGEIALWKLDGADVRKFWINSYCELKTTDPSGRIMAYLPAQAAPVIGRDLAPPPACRTEESITSA